MIRRRTQYGTAPLAGRAYTVVHPATIRSGATIDSAYVGEAQVGDTVEALGFAAVDGVRRIRTPVGWLSIQSKNGTQLLQPTDGAGWTDRSSSSSTEWSCNSSTSSSSGSTTSDSDTSGGCNIDEFEYTDSSTASSGSSSWTTTSSSLQPPPPVPCKVAVRTMNGHEESIEADTTMTVEMIKVLIEGKLGISAHEQRLLANHNELNADEVSLAEAGILNNMGDQTVLHLVLRLPPTPEELEQMRRDRLDRIRQRHLAYEKEKRLRRANSRRKQSHASDEHAYVRLQDTRTCERLTSLLGARFEHRLSNILLFVAAVLPALVIVVLARPDL